MVGCMDGLCHWELGSLKAKQLQIDMALSQNLGNPKSSACSWFPYVYIYILKWQYDQGTPNFWANLTMIFQENPKQTEILYYQPS